MNFALLDFPPEASSYAWKVDGIFLLILGLSVLVAASVFGLLIFFCIRYRAGSSAPRSRDRVNSTPIEITWTIIPFLLFLVFFIMAGREYATMYSPPARSIPIDIVGKQWMWKIQHADGRREIDQLHIPINENVTISLTSEDVVHSFFVPAFRVKHDAVPGTYGSFWFRAVKAGVYPFFCTQYCGKDHSLMIGQVIAMEPKDFAAWEAQGRPESDLASQGELLFREVGCSGCHSPGSTIHAPLLEGLFNKPVALEGSQVVVADRQYLRDSILLPNKQVAAGFAPVMPTYQGQLTEEQVNELVAYLMSIGNKPSTPPDNTHP